MVVLSSRALVLVRGVPVSEVVRLRTVGDLSLVTACAGRLVDRLKAELPFLDTRSCDPCRQVGEVSLMTRRGRCLAPCAVCCPT